MSGQRHIPTLLSLSGAVITDYFWDKSRWQSLRTTAGVEYRDIVRLRREALQEVKTALAAEVPALGPALPFIKYESTPASAQAGDYLGLARLGDPRHPAWVVEAAFANVASLRAAVSHEARHVLQALKRPDLLRSGETYARLREFDARLQDLRDRAALRLPEEARAVYLRDATRLWQQLPADLRQPYTKEWEDVSASTFSEVKNLKVDDWSSTTPSLQWDFARREVVQTRMADVLRDAARK